MNDQDTISQYVIWCAELGIDPTDTALVLVRSYLPNIDFYHGRPQ